MKKFAWLLFLLTFLLAFLYAFYNPAIMDYNAYQFHWKIIMEGQNPWGFEVFTGKENVYGPVYALFALPWSVHGNLPRLIFIFTWALMTYWLIGKLLKSEQLSNLWKVNLLLVLCASPFLWIRNVYFSQFDIVVALLLVLSIDYANNGRSSLAGGLIAIAVALKYYPLVVVPQLCFKHRKPVWQFIGTFTAAMVVIYGFTIYLWGMTFLKPLSIAVERPSKLLSIYQVLRSPLSPLSRWFGIENIDALSTPIFLIGVGLLTIYLIYKKYDAVSSSLLAFILMLILYKVGHQQFHVSLYLLLIYWLIMKAPHKPIVTIASTIYILFMNIADIGYMKTTFLGDWEIVRNLIGVPTFFILAFLFLAVFFEAKEKRSELLQANGLV